MHDRVPRSRVPALLLAALIGACDGAAPADPAPAPGPDAEAPIETVGATLALVPTRLDAARVAVDVVYAPRPGQVAPRMLELHVRYAPGLRFVEAAPLAALVAAGKELVAQDRGDHLRLVAFATSNARTLGAGPLARLVFDAPHPGAVALDPTCAFAPAAANDGVVLGAAVTVGGAP